MGSRNLLFTILLLVSLLTASGCSSLGVALDTSITNEDYSTERDINGEYKKGNDTSLQVLPKIVSSKQFRPLIDIRNTPATFGFGLDYEVYYYGYDTPRLISNVLNNKKSLSDAIEYPSEEVDGESNLNLFSISPVPLIIMNINQNVFFAGGAGIPLYTSISFNREKYEIKEENFDVTLSMGYSLPSPNNPYSVFVKFSQKKFKAQKIGSSEEELFTYQNASLFFRYYL